MRALCRCCRSASSLQDSNYVSRSEIFSLPTPQSIAEQGLEAACALRCTVGPDIDAEFITAEQDLVVPGRVVLLRRVQQKVQAYISTGLAPTLRRVELSKTMVEDHLADPYQAAIEQLYIQLGTSE